MIIYFLDEYAVVGGRCRCCPTGQSIFIQLSRWCTVR